MTKTKEEFPEKYFDELPSLCRYLTEMILSERYVFSADFLARGYRFDRLSVEKMWRMTCCPHQTTFQDVAQAAFLGNPDCLNGEEEEGIWTSHPTTEIQSFPYTVDVSRTVGKRKGTRKNDIRSPSNPEVQTSPLNFENIRKQLDDLKITREDRERLEKTNSVVVLILIVATA